MSKLSEKNLLEKEVGWPRVSAFLEYFWSDYRFVYCHNNKFTERIRNSYLQLDWIATVPWQITVVLKMCPQSQLTLFPVRHSVCIFEEYGLIQIIRSLVLTLNWFASFLVSNADTPNNLVCCACEVAELERSIRLGGIGFQTDIKTWWSPHHIWATCLHQERYIPTSAYETAFHEAIFKALPVKSDWYKSLSFSFSGLSIEK